MTNYTERTRLRAVQARDRRFDGKFVYGVSTTGIYCRPSCPSRRPKPTNVSFYSSVAAAEAMGFRPCKRCHPKLQHGNRAENAVSVAKRILDDAARSATLDQRTDLKYLGTETGVSPFHLQRHFKRIVGLSPKSYLSKQRSIQLRKNLKKGGTVLHASYESGFGSSSSAYAAAGKELGMSPSTYRRDGAGTTISYWVTESSLGRLMVAATERGVCAVMLGSSEKSVISELRAEFPKAILKRGDAAGLRLVRRVTEIIEGGRVMDGIPLDINASPFQWRVWAALRAIPLGETRTYGEIALAIGQPGAARAVGRACATNRAAIVIPCHRVIRGDGKTGDYRWGATLKQDLLKREAESRSR